MKRRTDRSEMKRPRDSRVLRRTRKTKKREMMKMKRLMNRSRDSRVLRRRERKEIRQKAKTMETWKKR